MRKRILSLVLAIAMCFSMVSVVTANDNDMELLEITLGEILDNYRDRVWEWQNYQFDAMTDEQSEVIDNAILSYEANKDAIAAVAENLAADLLKADNANFFDNETLKDLYKWKTMRDLMEGRIDATSDDAAYQAWLADFTAYEQANDEAVEPVAPIKALNGLGDYADDLTVYFGELADLVEGGLVLEGEDAAKVHAYVAAYVAGDDLATIKDALHADCLELMTEGMVNSFDIGVQVATNQVNQSNSDGVLNMIPDRDFKAGFLLLGEDFVRYLMDLIPDMRDDLLNMSKKDLIASVASADGMNIMSGDNVAAAAAMYDTMTAVANYVLGQDFCADYVTKVDTDLGINVNEAAGLVVDALENAMAAVNADHGLELVHLNTYMGRELLRYEDANGDLVKIKNAVIDGDTTSEINLGFANDRYPAFEEALNNIDFAQFDVEGDANGITVVAHDENIGQLVVTTTEEADGAVKVDVFRGYSDEDLDGTDEWAEDVYRYVASFTVTATSDVVVEEPYVELDDVADTTVDGTVTIQGETNLDHVTVAIIKNGETIYAVVYEKAEFEAGITLNAPDNAQEGEVYTVVVGTEKASASDEFAIAGAVVEDEVVLEDVADTTVDGTITIKGTTTLDYVTVAIIKNGQTIYAVVYEKAEFEEGITLPAPDNAQAGDVYTVVVGTEKASDSDEFAIVDVIHEITLEDIENFKLSEQDTITIKGTTTLDHVTVTIAKPDAEGDMVTVYAVVYTKDEYEAGITLNVPDNAQAGDVYTVAVGQDGTEAEDTFTILAEGEITLEDIADFKLSEQSTITVKGTTTLDYVTVTITKAGVEGAAGTVYAVVYTKDEYEAGITINVPDGAAAGDVYTVAVGQEGTEAEDTFAILEEEVVPPVEPTLALAGDTDGDGVADRTVRKGSQITITTTPQNIPEGATAEVRWTITNGEGEVEQVSVAGDFNNLLTIKGITVGEGVVITGTLYIDGVATDETVTINVTVKKKSTPGVSSPDYTTITVKVDETVDVKKLPNRGVNVEFIPASGDGEVKVSIVDGVIVVTGVKEGTVRGELRVTTETGSIVSTADYEFIVIKDETSVKHECEWPDIAATATKDAHWAHETIDIMTINGYINGYPDGTFKPDELITRAEFSAIVYRILGLTEAEDGVKYDDTVGHWAEDIIATMSLPEGYGMLRGYGDGNFGPNDHITREQAVAIIARAKSAVWSAAEEGAKDVFTDTEDISWWFDGEMDAAVTNGLITGYEDGSYKPLNNTTRAEACVLLARAWPEVLE